MARNTRNSETRGCYGRDIAASSQHGSGVSSVHAKDDVVTCIIKGEGSINSAGVVPDGSVSSLLNAQTEVEFSIEVYRKGNCYQGNIYVVSYDTRKKINSNNLTYFNMPACDQAICIFEVCHLKGCQMCSYDLYVNLSPTSCHNNMTGALFAYAAPIYNVGVNIGGFLEKGEIIFCEDETDYSSCCECENK